MSVLDDIPYAEQYEAFSKLAAVTDYYSLSPKDRDRYDESLRVLRDNYATYKAAVKEGLEEGRAKGRAEGRAEGEKNKEKELVLAMHKNGASLDDITRLTNLPLETVKQILN